ncbi:hypothetical protein IFR04_015729 [Cadophora malorum]|uniref:Zn(2)-C6 fungal-type domain-containing protein n=1 Tax=Cadophora malorum TaxID=108018 RepID=A0A8H7VZ68_9HELO|nr:hypothetical protein IFR04_015729 [Cadophora malorum]
MDIPPDKRPRLSGPPPTPWQNSPEGSRQLPSPGGPQHYHPSNPFSRPPEPHPLDHRRPSEHSPYDHQDPRRPGSGPSHGYHNGPPQPPPPPAPPSQQPPIPPYAGQRDPMVKRDPSDEPQQYRPPSTGVDHNVMPSPHHEGPGRPYHPSYDPARNQQYQPPQQQNPYPPVQSPMSATEPYGNNPYGPGGGLPPPRDFQTVTYPTAAPRGQDIRKKAQRAAQACDSCRTLKAKCDEGRPACSTCKEKGTECRYRDPPPKQQDKASADIMDSLARLESFMSGFNNKIEHVNKKIENLTGEMRDIKHAQNGTVASSANYDAVKLEQADSFPRHRVDYPRPSIVSENQPLLSNESPYGSTPSQPRATGGYPSQGGETDEEEDTGNPGPSKPPSIPVNHTTGAARLLNVPAIRALCQGAMQSSKIKNEKYPILQEEKRGLLRLFGRGEGYEPPPGYDKDPLGDHGADSTPGDSHSDVSSPAGEEWGQLGGLTPPGHQPDFVRGGIDANGMPDLSRETVLDLVKSYMEHINIMHPILIKSRLDLLVEHFLKSIPESQAKPKQVSTLQAGHTSYNGPGFVGSGYRNPESPGNKRKRSPIAGDYAEPHAVLEHKPGHPFRSIGSAIVLLVMALGKICQYKGKIPDGWASDRDLDNSYGSSPTVRNGHPPSPIQSSPGMGMGSPMDGERGQPRSRRTSIDGAYPARNPARPRNIDIIPGLAYHALATDVIGNQLAGNSLQHVHANILAGLYHGQLARVMESHGYIAAACRSLQVILRPKLDRLRRIKEQGSIISDKDNPLVVAFWTCLQLESDIVAELPCPHSGILTYEEDMPHPNFKTEEDGKDNDIVHSYIGQLFLRKHLNQLHNMFYRPDGAPFNSANKTKEHHPTIDASVVNLHAIFNLMSTKMGWNPAEGEPANEILRARLRAKFYGAEVITYRHFILKVLERDSAGDAGGQIAPEYLPKFEAPVIRKNVQRIEDLDPKVLHYIECGIKALIFSTKAFHGLGDPGKDRLIVTNVWGTAHAQWGNMVTLLAAYMNPILNEILLRFITVHELRQLTETTLAFLQLTASPTSALHSDYKILRYMGQKTGITPPQGPNTGSSFSSSTTGDVPMTGH